jgi:hypothetical protein
LKSFDSSNVHKEIIDGAFAALNRAEELGKWFELFLILSVFKGCNFSIRGNARDKLSKNSVKFLFSIYSKWHEKPDILKLGMIIKTLTIYMY